MLRQSDDRRARRTRRALKQGLGELLREKPFAEITVRDITDRVDLNRGTFYLHYKDPLSLLESMEEDALQEAQEMIDAHATEVDSKNLRPVLEPILRYIVENRPLCVSLLSSNGSGFIDQVQRLIRTNGDRIVSRRYPDATAVQREYLLSFAGYGLIGLVRSWFEQGMPLSQPALLDLAEELLDSTAEKVFAATALPL